MRRYASTNRIRQNDRYNNIQDDEEGLIYDENQGFDISPRHRKKKVPSKFAPQQEKAKYIQHFPGGYKVESEVPAGSPVPFQAPPFGSQFPGTPYMGTPYMGTPYTGNPYFYPPQHPYFGGYGYGYNAHYPGMIASKFGIIKIY